MTRKLFKTDFKPENGSFVLRVAIKSHICNGSPHDPGCKGIISPGRPYLDLIQIRPEPFNGKRFLLCEKCGKIVEVNYNLFRDNPS
jgi:hypothetical protein